MIQYFHMHSVSILLLTIALFAGCSSDSSPTPAPRHEEEEALSSEDSLTTPENASEKPCTNSPSALGLGTAQARVDGDFWNGALASVWEGIKARNIAPYGTGLIHRPKSETPGDAVSEGVGYGMLVALYSNDQATFNSIWEAGNAYMWSSCYYNWKVTSTGSLGGSGAATDAEEDIALALIFADKLVSAGKWSDYTSPIVGSYKTQALSILSCMWYKREITTYGIVAPGAGWGGSSFVNPGYFSPASYKVFAAYDSSHDWNSVVDMSYNILYQSPALGYGMVMDWMTPAGNAVGSSSLGYNAYGGGVYFFKDAIRILWRVALDAIWFNESRATAFLKNSLAFINAQGGASAANFYQMDGSLIPEEDVWTELAGGTIARFRREHSHLTTGMWATAAMAVGDSSDMKSFSKEMKKFYEGGDYFGNAVDPLGGIEDTLHNEMYFDQFLGWFGASLLSGTFVNIVDAIDNPATTEQNYCTD